VDGYVIGIVKVKESRFGRRVEGGKELTYKTKGEVWSCGRWLVLDRKGGRD